MEYSMGIPRCFTNNLKWDPVPFKVMAVMVLFFDVQRLFVERWKIMEAFIAPKGVVFLVISSTLKVEVLFLADLFHNSSVYIVIWLCLIGVSKEDSLDLHRWFVNDLKWDMVPALIMVVTILFSVVQGLVVEGWKRWRILLYFWKMIV
ncbi:hypothetical protein MA16_Dca018466 [Dendrobium catenatum]|uniref:Uncharacterized protein n=1 Tax=Dendrobium catenatum TaxID=906689 RepID=A0A2I0X7E0_9ASPA|nr:hypothetical protein MA16_Dca018466 [Dendrobium catenatum]